MSNQYSQFCYYLKFQQNIPFSSLSDVYQFFLNMKNQSLKKVQRFLNVDDGNDGIHFIALSDHELENTMTLLWLYYWRFREEIQKLCK